MNARCNVRVSMPLKCAQITFENARLFVRENGTWKLLAWANERSSSRTTRVADDDAGPELSWSFQPVMAI